MDHKPTTFGPTLLIIEKILEDEDLVSFNNFDNNRAFTFNNFRLNDGNDNMTLNFHLTSSRTSMIKGIN
jgi:Mg2+ and Co2+ transporter CorA